MEHPIYGKPVRETAHAWIYARPDGTEVYVTKYWFKGE